MTPVILGFIRLGCQTGYDVKSVVDSSTRFFWAASYGQIYPELRRLEQAGLVAGESAPRGDRRRTAYRLTPAGEQAFREWLLAPQEDVELRHEGLLKLFFAGTLGPEEAVEMLRSMRAHNEGVLARLREIEPLAEQAGRFPSLVLDYGLGLHEWAIAWCDEAERRLLEEGGS